MSPNRLTVNSFSLLRWNLNPFTVPYNNLLESEDRISNESLDENPMVNPRAFQAPEGQAWRWALRLRVKSLVLYTFVPVAQGTAHWGGSACAARFARDWFFADANFARFLLQINLIRSTTVTASRSATWVGLCNLLLPLLSEMSLSALVRSLALQQSWSDLLDSGKATAWFDWLLARSRYRADDIDWIEFYWSWLDAGNWAIWLDGKY